MHCRILVVDDEPANVHLLDRFLKEAGFTNIRTTNDPREALRIYREQQPDIVLLDLLMPFLDGFAVSIPENVGVDPKSDAGICVP